MVDELKLFFLPGLLKAVQPAIVLHPHDTDGETVMLTERGEMLKSQTTQQQQNVSEYEVNLILFI